MVSLVKESLTETVTRIHDDSDLADYWDRDDSTSVELAHKEGFRHGLKVALALLTLIIGGLFIGNFQKIQQVVRPGFIPQDIISDEPVKESDLVTESSPSVLDEATAAELQADGKIIIVDEVEKVDPDLRQINPLTDKQGDKLPGDELPLEKLPAENSAGQEIILDQETVIERQVGKPATKNVSESAIEKPEQGVDEPEPKIVVIEEVALPVRKENLDSESPGKFESLVDFLVDHGKEGSGKSEELKEQLGGQELENK